MNQGAADFLTKPVEIADLLATVKKVYADYKMRRNAWKTESQLAAVRREMDLAGTIQKRILPRTFPNSGEMDIFAQTTPAQEMGGDFYDFFDMPGGKTALVVADVSGKGVAAAFYMAVVRTLFRAVAPAASGPATCLTDVNRLLIGHDIPGMFVTVFLIAFVKFGIDERRVPHLEHYDVFDRWIKEGKITFENRLFDYLVEILRTNIFDTSNNAPGRI